MACYIGARPMDVGWLRNGMDIPDSDEFRYINRGNMHQLVIAEIFPEDSGKYTCEALNDLGEADCHCVLNVIGEKSWLWFCEVDSSVIEQTLFVV